MSCLNSRRFDSDALPGLLGRAVLARLPGPHLMRSSRTFSLSLTTTVFSQRSTGWFDACPRRPTSEGHTSISCTASLPKDLLHGSSFCVRDALPPRTLPVTALVSCDGERAIGWGPSELYGGYAWWRSTIVAEAMKAHVLNRSPCLVNRAWSRLSRPARGSLRTRAWRLSHPRCDSIQQWAVSTPGAAVKPVRPRVTVRRPRPSITRSINQGYDYFLSLPEEYVVPERHLARIPRGCLIGDHGLLVLPNGALSTESVYEHLYGESRLTQAPISAGQGERFVEGNFYSLLNRFAAEHNYYHWLHDVVIPLHVCARSLAVRRPLRRPDVSVEGSRTTPWLLSE